MEDINEEYSTLEEEKSYLAFSLGAESFAFPLLKVKEVIALGKLTPLPNTPSYLKGIMNLRGKVISIVDLRLKLKMAVSNEPEKPTVIILNMANASLGVIVDSVDTVLSLARNDIQPPPPARKQEQTGHISGVAQQHGRLVLMMDIEEILNAKEMEEAIKKAA